MENVILIVVILAILGGAAFYIYKAKKSGAKCIGCPNSKSCSGHCSSCNCNCGHKAIAADVTERDYTNSST